MKQLSILCLFLMSCVVLFAQEVQIFEKNGKYGLKSQDNKIIAKANYDYIHPLTDSYFLIEKQGKIGLITSRGTIVLEPIYNNVKLFGDNLFWVESNNKWGIVDTQKKEILPLDYSGYTQINDYLYTITAYNRMGVIDKFGTILVPVLYDEISEFTYNILLAKGKSYMSLIDNAGNTILSGNFDSMKKLPNTNLYQVQVNNKYGIMDTSGKLLADASYDEVQIPSDYYIVLKKEDKFGFIVNNKLIPANYNKVVFVQEDYGVLVVRAGKLNGFITTQGLVVPPIYDNISRFSGKGHALVEKSGKLMYVDITGKESTLQEISGTPRL